MRHNFGTLDERVYHCYECDEPLENIEQLLLDELGPEDSAILIARENHDKGRTHLGFCDSCWSKIAASAVIL